jgi:XTP/dITP diphosphohydrolase
MSEHLAPDVSAPGRSLVLASGNPGKLRELTEMLRPIGWIVRSQKEWALAEAVEDGLTFIENALIKARHASQNTGLPSLGDDSGLVVDALDGAPGIKSARYAGEPSDDAANNRKLLSAIKNVPAGQRTAHFYCALAMVRYANDPAPLISTGAWHGSIAESPKGSGGFGYDPVFWVASHACTSAELESAVKNQQSHRGQALAFMMEQIKALTDSGYGQPD